MRFTPDHFPFGVERLTPQQVVDAVARRLTGINRPYKGEANKYLEIRTVRSRGYLLQSREAVLS